MKKLNNKIGAVALIALLVLPFLSQGLVANAILSLSSSNTIVLPYDEFQEYRVVKQYEGDSRYGYYDAIYLGNERIDVNESYSDIYQFKKKGLLDLKKHSWREKPIFIKVGKSYFKIFFNLTDHQRKMILIRDIAEHYGFKLLYAHRSDYYGGRQEFDSHVMNRDDIKGNQDLVYKLTQEPSEKFPSIQDFANKLKEGFELQEGYSRLRIGEYDYLFSR